MASADVEIIITNTSIRLGLLRGVIRQSSIHSLLSFPSTILFCLSRALGLKNPNPVSNISQAGEHHASACAPTHAMPTITLIWAPSSWSWFTETVPREGHAGASQTGWRMSFAHWTLIWIFNGFAPALFTPPLPLAERSHFSSTNACRKHISKVSRASTKGTPAATDTHTHLFAQGACCWCNRQVPWSTRVLYLTDHTAQQEKPFAARPPWYSFKGTAGAFQRTSTFEKMMLRSWMFHEQKRMRLTNKLFVMNPLLSSSQHIQRKITQEV